MVDRSYEANRHDFHRDEDPRNHNCVECGFDSRHPYHQTPIERAVADRRAGRVKKADEHGNVVANEGVDQCWCGCKYWENDKCIDCGTHVQSKEQSREQA